jgi:hypothetical protein
LGIALFFCAGYNACDMKKIVRSFTVSFFNNSSEYFEVHESSVLMGEGWSKSETPKMGQKILAGQSGGPWKTITIDEDMGTGGVVCLVGASGELVIHWLLTPDGKQEIQVGQEKYQVNSERVDELGDENHLLWRFSIADAGH